MLLLILKLLLLVVDVVMVFIAVARVIVSIDNTKTVLPKQLTSQFLFPQKTWPEE